MGSGGYAYFARPPCPEGAVAPLLPCLRGHKHQKSTVIGVVSLGQEGHDGFESCPKGKNFTFWLCVGSSQRQEIKFLDEKRYKSF